MSFEARVLKVFIASPGDVMGARATIREVLHEWNAVHGEARRFLLQPVGWETDSAPELGQPPQQLINQRLLKSCDILIGVFWTRLGTPTQTAPSGTVEEIREHLTAKRLTMLYFSKQPVAPDSIDGAQYEALVTFRKECEAQGLREVFMDLGDLRAKLVRQLGIQLNQRYPHEAPHVVAAANGLAVPRGARSVILSSDALDLLRAAAADKNGASIAHVRAAMGDGILAGGREFTDEKDPRSEARWKAALRELEEAGLVADEHGTRYRYAVTHRGFEVADDTQREA